MNYYMTINPFTLTNMETLETINLKDLDGLLELALTKSAKIYCYELNEMAMPIVNKLYGLGFEEIPTADLENPTSAIDKMKFVQITSRDRDCGSITYNIRINKRKGAIVNFINASNLFGGLSKNSIIKSITGEDNGLENEVLSMITAIDNLLSQGHTRWTLSSNAFKDMQHTCFVNKKGEYIHAKYNETFPKLEDEVHDFVISSFQNGLTLYNEAYIGINEVEGTSYDVNSMYPSIMMQEAMPVEKPVYFKGQYIPDGKNGYMYFFQKVRINKLTLKEDGIECLRNKKEANYYKEAENLEVVLNSVDLELLFDNYEVDGIEYIDGYKFQAKKGKKIFGNYINKWMEVKKNAADGSFERNYAKLMLNSCFGKFASKTDKTPTYCRYNRKHQRYEIRKYLKGKRKTEGNSVYAPVGCYITSIARKRLIEAIKANKENFIYADTDSIYVKGEATGIEVDSKELGKWKVENKFKRMNIIGKKQYCIERHDGSLKMAIAGVPEAQQDQVKSFDEFKLGLVFKRTVKIYNLDGEVASIDEETYTLKNEEIN